MPLCPPHLVQTFRGSSLSTTNSSESPREPGRAGLLERAAWAHGDPDRRARSRSCPSSSRAGVLPRTEGDAQRMSLQKKTRFWRLLRGESDTTAPQQRSRRQLCRGPEGCSQHAGAGPARGCPARRCSGLAVAASLLPEASLPALSQPAASPPPAPGPKPPVRATPWWRASHEAASPDQVPGDAQQLIYTSPCLSPAAGSV